MTGPAFKANVSEMTLGHKKGGKSCIKARNRQPLEEKSAAENAGKHRTKKRRTLSFVILVEKNSDFQNAVRSELTKMKVDLRTATDPMKAKDLYFWEKESRGHVDLVVSCLGAADSITLLNGIRQQDPQARIIVICQDASAEERTQLTDAGAHAIIVSERKTKPGVSELRRIITENL